MVLRWQGWFRTGLLLVVVGWGALSLSSVPLLATALPPAGVRRALLELE